MCDSTKTMRPCRSTTWRPPQRPAMARSPGSGWHGGRSRGARLVVDETSGTRHLGCRPALLERGDLRFVIQDVPELVEAGQEAFLREGIDRELRHAAARQPRLLTIEIDRDLRARIGGERLEERRMRRRVQGDRQQAVLQAVAAEDVGERGAD